jgi:hypothetical protein
MGITIRDVDGVVPTGEVGDIGQAAGASLLSSGGQKAASRVSPEGYVIHRQSPLRDSRAGKSCARLGSSSFRDFGDGGALVSSIRGRFVLEGLSGLSGEVGEGEEDEGELAVEWASSGGQRNEVGLVCTERGAGSLEGFGESSWMEGGGWGQTMSVESQGSSESALRLRGREWRGMDSWAMSSMRRGRGRVERLARGGEEGIYPPRNTWLPHYLFKFY